MWPPRTLAITHRQRLGGRGPDDEQRCLVHLAEGLAQAGVDALQVRERDWADGRLLSLVRDVCAATAGTGCLVLVNERAHVALAAGAHGVHLRGTGMPASRLRAVVPLGWSISRSVHAGDEPAAVMTGVDVALFGTVFASGSKPDGWPVAGLDGLGGWVARAGRPVVAVGGITPGRCVAVRDAGACGVAGIELFVQAWQQGADALVALVREVHAVFQVECAE